MPKMFKFRKRELLVQLIILALSSVIFYLLAGPALAILFTIIWIDKTLSPFLRVAEIVGFELTTLPVIVIGIIYGPLFGFLFGFLVVAFIGGILNIISWRMATPVEVTWPPIVPSPDHLIDGAIAGLSGYLIGTTPLFWVMLICLLLKNFLVGLKENFMLGYINVLARILNVLINFSIFLYLQGFILYLISL